MKAVPEILEDNLREKIENSKLLVVGAGGIGCEILKNLALSGFNNIDIIDLDIIDVSNLNRQFLFRKEHVGKSKSLVAKESITKFNPDISINAYHDSITTPKYGVNFFKKFNMVLNALDNRTARNHVNRMCLAADVPLIESGTAGYTGQVELIKKGLTQCYECQPKPPQKSFPGCTIRNTPSEPVHCIVWAKHLFNQLFGEDDPDQDVSPDTADPEAAANAGEEAAKSSATEEGNVKRVSTHQWAQDIDYDPSKLFNKFFEDDIKYLLSMDNLWKTRTPPKPLNWAAAASHQGDVANSGTSEDMQIWPLNKCATVFAETIVILKKELATKSFLVWDKDDQPALDFVTACANIRSQIFSIPQKSRFDIKSIAGNIIPAIATTNAMVAGLVVLHAFRILKEEFDRCQTIYVRQKSSASKTVLMAETNLERANPKCYVCSPQPFVNVHVNINTMKIKEFESEILKKSLNMIAPDVMLEGKGDIVISSEEGETECNMEKTLLDMGIIDGSILKADDFLQNYELTICVNEYIPNKSTDEPYKVVTDSELKAKDDDSGNGASGSKGETDSKGGSSKGESKGESSKAESSSKGESSKGESSKGETSGNGESSGTNKSVIMEEDDDLEVIEDDDLEVMETDELDGKDAISQNADSNSTSKVQVDEEKEGSAAKKRRVNDAADGDVLLVDEVAK